jgi:serine/threonine protein kinase
VDDDARIHGTGRAAGPVQTALSARVVPPHVVFTILTLMCGAAVPVVPLLGRAPWPTRAAALTFAMQALICLLLALLNRFQPPGRNRVLQTAALVTLGLFTAAPGYFFGPNSGFAAFVALVLVLTGVLAGGTDVRYPALAGWLTWLAMSLGQAAVMALVLLRFLPDDSLTVTIIEPHPMWHHAIAHAALQVIYFASFICGRVFQRRYRALARQVEETARLTARREAVLDEVRAEYKRTLASGRSGLFSGSTVGDYRLGELLGRGGMAEVYEAVHAGDNRSVAVKLLRGDRIDDPQAVDRFLQETEVATRVESPLVARVYGVGRVQQGMPFIAMERLEGESLATILLRHGPLPPGELRDLVVDVSSALEAIHAQGIVHLDVKPSNIVRASGSGGRPTWKLIDFGVAQARAAVAAEALPVGTLRYMAPEKLSGKSVDARTDIFGLSATIYAAITAHEPFEDLSAPSLPAAAARQLPMAPRHYVDVHEDVELALRIGLAKDPAERYATPRELREALLSALDGRLAAADRERARTLERGGTWSAGAPPQEQQIDATLPTCGPPPGQQGDLAGLTPPAPPVDVDAERAAPDARASMPPPSLTGSSTTPKTAWQDAYRSKMRGFFAGINGLCAAGALLMLMIGRERDPLIFALACIAGIVVAAWLQRFLAAQRPHVSIYWPWAVVGTLSIGPAYSLGLHSGFASVLVLWLFAGGIFRAAHRWGWLDRRGLVLAGILLGNTGLFVLILLGIVPDDGNLAVRQAGSQTWGLVILHVLLMSAYVAAFLAGQVVDRRHEALTIRVEAAVRTAARQEALLATVRSQLEIALDGGGGIFTGQLIGRYQVGRLMGRGGMGEVYEATQSDSGQRVALKFIRGDRAAQPNVLKMFLKEGRTLNLVRSPYVARVLDVAGIDDELPFVALEFIEGRTLADILREHEQLGLPEIREMVHDVGRGLQDVHDAGILHRDIKPSNVIRTTSDESVRWKLVDFGIAKMISPGAAATGPLVIGTPAYMSPEQALGNRLDARSDVYSLSLVIYRALAGRPAFTGHDPAGIAAAAAAGGPPDPSPYVDLPADVVRVLRIGLAARPEDRFASAAELTLAFEEACEGKLSDERRRRAADLLRRQPWAK